MVPRVIFSLCPEESRNLKSGQEQNNTDPFTTRQHLTPPSRARLAPNSLIQRVARMNRTLTDGICNDSNSNNKINNNDNICPKGIYTQRACFSFV